MKERRVVESTEGSLNSAMGEPFMARISELIAGHKELPIAPDAISSWTPAAREALSDPDSQRSLRALWFSKYLCNQCVWRSQTRAKKTLGITTLTF